MAVNYRAELRYVSGEPNPPRNAEGLIEVECSIEHGGRRYAARSWRKYISSHPLDQTAALAAQMVAAGVPDGDVHLATWMLPRRAAGPVQPVGTETRHEAMERVGWIVDPVERVYVCSFGPLSKLARWHVSPQLDHREYRPDLRKWSDFQMVEELRASLMPGMRLDFLHHWRNGHFLRYPPADRRPTCQDIAELTLLPQSEWHTVERPKSHKRRFYFVELQNETAEFAFAIRWSGSKNDTQGCGPFIRWSRWND